MLKAVNQFTSVSCGVNLVVDLLRLSVLSTSLPITNTTFSMLKPLAFCISPLVPSIALSTAILLL